MSFQPLALALLPQQLVPSPRPSTPSFPAAKLAFHSLSPAELRQWVRDHPGHVNDWDRIGQVALCVAARKKDLSLVLWLIDAQGAHVNRRTKRGGTPLHYAACPRVVRALLERKADPAKVDRCGWTALMTQVVEGRKDCIACLLEGRRAVRDGWINATSTPREKGERRCSALDLACSKNQTKALRLLIEAGADPTVRLDRRGRQLTGPTQVNREAKAVLEEGLDAYRAACLVQLRRLVVQKRGVAVCEEKGGGLSVGARMLAAVVGVGVRGNLPRDVFTVLMDLLLPVWSPLRKGLGKK